MTSERRTHGGEDPGTIRRQFREVVTMTAGELEKWLGTEEGVETSRWRYSLMNWGHDPLKKR